MKQPGHLFTIKVRNDQKSLKRRWHSNEPFLWRRSIFFYSLSKKFVWDYMSNFLLKKI
jgi:hypothetical protein